MYSFNHFKEVQFIYTSLQKQIIKIKISDFYQRQST